MGSGSGSGTCDDQTPKLPKLSLFSLPIGKAAADPPGMLTPPMKTLASVPFQWEEVPGKPRPCCVGDSTKPKSVVRRLELPPRLLTSGIPFPTTVLDGPYASMSFRKGGSSSFRIPPPEKVRILVGSSSSRWGSFKKNSKEIGGGFDHFLFSDIKSDAGGDRGATKVKITRVRSSLSQSKSSNLLTSVYESFKQVVPFTWSWRQEKLRKRVSS